MPTAISFDLTTAVNLIERQGSVDVLIACRLQLVAEEDSEDLRKPEGKAMLDEITQLVNDALRDLQHGASLAQELSGDDVLDLIDLGDSQAGASGKHWVLDPIDGTRGFENLRQYAICLGLLIDGVSTIGVLGCPNIPLGRPATQADGEPDSAAGTTRDAIGAIFAAARGAGAFEGSLDGKGVGHVFAVQRQYARPNATQWTPTVNAPNHITRIMYLVHLAITEAFDMQSQSVLQAYLNSALLLRVCLH